MKNLSPLLNPSHHCLLLCRCKASVRKGEFVTAKGNTYTFKSNICAKLPSTFGDAHLGTDDVLDAVTLLALLLMVLSLATSCVACILTMHSSQIKVRAHLGLKRDGAASGW